MKLLWSYIKEYRKLLAGALVLATVNQVFSLLDPQVFRLIVDNYATKFKEFSQVEFLHGVGFLLLAAVGVAFVSRVAKNFQDYYVNVITQRVGARLYAASVAHSFSLPYRVFEDQRSGELLQILQRARNDAQRFIMSAVNVVFVTVVGITFVVVYAFTTHWSIGSTYFLIIPLLGVTTLMLSRRIKAAQQAIIAETADLAGSTTETLRNVELVKSLGLEEQETNRLNRVNSRILELELKKVKLIRKFSFTQGTLINAMRSLLMLLLLYLVFQEAITLGQFFSLLFYSFFLFNPLGEFGNVSAQYQEAKGSMEALERILALPPAEKPAHPVPVPVIDHIAFEDASFAYTTGTGNAVSNLSLEIKGGASAAFVGPSGSGKTTVMKLMLGLYQPTSGSLRIGGADSRMVDYDAIRMRVGYVSQETQLFAGTIRENLLFVRPDATDRECVTAMEQAAAKSILDRSGKGLDTKIGESGLKLSGGEKQRLAIARALLRNPDLIIFDEATSSLDSITEKAITETIRGIHAARPNLMVVMVAHRLSTVLHADTIYVLERGRIAEEGSHSKLLSAGGLYAALWREQSAEGPESQPAAL